LGVGKSTLINILFDQEIIIIDDLTSSRARKLYIYFYILENKNYTSLIETPGVYLENYDDKDKDKDNRKLKEKLDFIKKEKIDIKGIFLANFQLKLDYCHMNLLFKYNKILFPFIFLEIFSELFYSSLLFFW